MLHTSLANVKNICTEVQTAFFRGPTRRKIWKGLL